MLNIYVLLEKNNTMALISYLCMDNLVQSGLFLYKKIYVCHIETLKSFYNYQKMIKLLFTRDENVMSVSFSLKVIQIYAVTNLKIYLEYH